LFVIVPVTESETDVYVVIIKGCHCYQLRTQFFPAFKHNITLHADRITRGVWCRF